MQYFTLEELLKSDAAVKLSNQNSPSWEVVDNLKRLVNEILDPIRKRFGGPITVTSGFRNAKVNRYVKGSETSQHKNGEAADIKSKTPSRQKELWKLILEMIDSGEIKVGQAIHYSPKQNPESTPQWIHVSLPGGHLNQILYKKN